MSCDSLDAQRNQCDAILSLYEIIPSPPTQSSMLVQSSCGLDGQQRLLSYPDGGHPVKQIAKTVQTTSGYVIICNFLSCTQCIYSYTTKSCSMLSSKLTCVANILIPPPGSLCPHNSSLMIFMAIYLIEWLYVVVIFVIPWT